MATNGEEEMSKHQATRQTYNPRGFTFITRDDGQPNLFCHANQLEQDAGMSMAITPGMIRKTCPFSMVAILFKGAARRRPPP
jgi:hypothetical protein